MANWPDTLPQNFLSGASISDDDSRIRTQMDSGPALVRNRFTAITQSTTTNIILTGAQLATFNTFLRTTLQQGAASFLWINPATGAAATLRFKTKPKWTCIRPSSNVNNRLWQAQLDLEVLP